LREETGIDAIREEVAKTHRFAPAPEWSYTTFVVDVPARVAHASVAWETTGSGWFTEEELRALPLHPGMERALDELLDAGHPDVSTNAA